MSTREEFARFSPGEFEAWLRNRLIDLYCDDPVRQRRAANLRDLGVARFDSMIDGLLLLFRQLDTTAQSAFQQALGNLMRHARPDDFPSQGMIDVITLIGFTQAHSQLSAFEPVLGSGDWGETAPELFRFALSVLKGLKTGSEAYDTTKYLLTCRHFPQAYIFDAYEVLIASEPRRWDADLQAVSERIQALELEVKNDREDKHGFDLRYASMVETLLNSVSLSRVREGLVRLTGQVEHLSPAHPTGRVLQILTDGTGTGGIYVDPETEELVLKLHEKNISRRLSPLPPEAELYIQMRRTEYRTDTQPEAAERPMEWFTEEAQYAYDRAQMNMAQVLAPRNTPERKVWTHG